MQTGRARPPRPNHAKPLRLNRARPRTRNWSKPGSGRRWPMSTPTARRQLTCRRAVATIRALPHSRGPPKPRRIPLRPFRRVRSIRRRPRSDEECSRAPRTSARWLGSQRSSRRRYSPRPLKLPPHAGHRCRCASSADPFPAARCANDRRDKVAASGHDRSCDRARSGAAAAGGEGRAVGL